MNIVELDYDSLKKDVLFEKGFLLINKLLQMKQKQLWTHLALPQVHIGFKKVLN